VLFGAVIVDVLIFNVPSRHEKHLRPILLGRKSRMELLLASTISDWDRLSLGTMWSMSPNVLEDHQRDAHEGPL